MGPVPGDDVHPPGAQILKPFAVLSQIAFAVHATVVPGILTGRRQREDEDLGAGPAAVIPEVHFLK